MRLGRAALLSCALIACGDNDGPVPNGKLDAGADAAIDASTLRDARCGFDQTYTVYWPDRYPASLTRVTFRPPLGYALEVFGDDGGVQESCSTTLTCGQDWSVDAQDVEENLSDPALVAFFSDDAGVLGWVDDLNPHPRQRFIQRQDGKRILFGDCFDPTCGNYPEAIWGVDSLFEALQDRTGTYWSSCFSWPHSRAGD